MVKIVISVYACITNNEVVKISTIDFLINNYNSAFYHLKCTPSLTLEKSNPIHHFNFLYIDRLTKMKNRKVLINAYVNYGFDSSEVRSQIITYHCTSSIPNSKKVQNKNK